MGDCILFVIPDERKVYETVDVKAGAFHQPSLALGILGAIARDCGFSPAILDLTLHDNGPEVVKSHVSMLQPRYVGIPCTSATYWQAVAIARLVKTVSASAKVMIGGPHVSSTVAETLQKGCFDYVFVGEAELSFRQLLTGADPLCIEGVVCAGGAGTIGELPGRPFLKNLDDFPFPDYGLYDLSRYRVSRLQVRRNPVAWMETSRGCPFDCQICNKVVHGRTFRPKSAERVLDEIKYFKTLGIRELHIADDGFTTDMERAERICEGMVTRRLDMTWSCVNGIRADRVNKQLLKLMKRAGCYRISFGIESGNQSVLDHLGKKITLSQIESAVTAAREAGLEVFGFFMFGFEDETVPSMQDTIHFARRLRLDLAKASIVTPFPGSPLYEKYQRRGLLLPVTDDYRHYNVYGSPRLVYRHPSLDWDVVEHYQKRFYRDVYLNPAYLMRRIVYSVKNGTILDDAAAALSMKWFGR
jgi:anaerobic magnesium-protoporphyrin IX monomethyl ester cyclase